MPLILRRYGVIVSMKGSSGSSGRSIDGGRTDCNIFLACSSSSSDMSDPCESSLICCNLCSTSINRLIRELESPSCVAVVSIREPLVVLVQVYSP